MRVGICGFPGSGKSTVFKALSPGAGSSRGGVAYGNIKVPDERVDRLTAIFHPKKSTYAEITFLDVPGQPGRKGAAFTAEVVQAMYKADVLAHVVRAFESPYLSEAADPTGDVERFNEELVLIDLAVLDKRRDRFQREGRKDGTADVNTRCVEHLEDGEPLRTLALTEEQQTTLQGIQLLSRKPMLTLFNVAEDDWEDSPLRTTEAPHSGATLALCGELEAEIARMEPEDQAEMLEGLGLGRPARDEFIRAAFGMLDLISFLTSGPDECRAWPVRKGTTARRAAGTIHSDLERGFIRAEVYTVDDLEELGSEAELKKAGRMRVEGKDYVVRDGDVMHVRFNV